MSVSLLGNIWARYKPEIIIIPPIFAADRISKILAADFLQPLGSLILAPFFRLTYVENTGAAFGLFQNGNFFLACLALVILFFLLKWRADFIKYGQAARCAVNFIIAGAIANLYDRIILGYVIDYLDFIIWPVFNIADSFITTGVVLLFFSIIKNKREN
ncbi:MAG: signal peptidase II [Elusimicrobiota bacterium]|jgi:signal peptidase II|nr:signal peptidase II [Elusimicrobiota bacterium]